jgi:hypothetical protein
VVVKLLLLSVSKAMFPPLDKPKTNALIYRRTAVVVMRAVQGVPMNVRHTRSIVELVQDHLQPVSVIGVVRTNRASAE